MVNKFFTKGKKFFMDPQSSVLSAATIIMLMIVASRVLGLIRQRTLAHFFTPNELSLFFAAFRLPDLVFEVLVFGTFSSAFIPVFTKALDKGNSHAWKIASTIVNIGLLFFVLTATLMSLGAESIYRLFAPGYSESEILEIASIAKILFAAQGFFVVSYVLTGVLESLRRFLIPALAPLFYNLGIIFGTIVFAGSYDLMAPTYGVLIGAIAHFLIQLPLAYKLGFRFSFRIFITKDIRKIGRLALPRIVEVVFLQISKTAELFLSSLITTASYTYYTFGNTIQLLPVGLFGTSIAKAALPTLARQSEDREKFSKTLIASLNQLIFFTAPIATMLVVLRIPIVRLIYGTDIFDWNSTIQTGYVISGFAVGVVFQAANALLARGFYALHNTKTPVKISIAAIIVTIFLDFTFIRYFGFSVWGLALGMSIGSVFQSLMLLSVLNKNVLQYPAGKLLAPILKITFSSVGSGFLMYFILKFFDRSVWVKRLSFLTNIEAVRYLPFERFVLDTRYTINLLILTIAVAAIGGFVYLGISFLIKSEEIYIFFNLLKRIFIKKKLSPIPAEEKEPVTPTPTETTTT